MAEKNAAEKQNGLLFKEKPLVRSGNIMYYGFPTDRFIAKLELVESDAKVVVDLLDAEDPSKPRPIMKTERATLYDALDIAWIWTERAQAESQKK